MKNKIKFPIHIKKNCDFWRLNSENGGHFLRVWADGECYCYQSNDVKEGEARLLLNNLDDYNVISEREYMNALGVQVKRNNAILKRLERLEQVEV